MIVVGHACGKFFSRGSFQPSGLFPTLRKRWFESNSGENRSQNVLTQTSVLVQEGLDIEEVPLIVRKINDIGTICTSNDKKGMAVKELRNNLSATSKNTQQFSDKKKSKSENDDKTKNKSLKGRIDIETDEGTAILFCSDMENLENANIDSHNTMKGMYSLLENKVAQEINCKVAVEGLRKIIDLENNLVRNKPKNAWLEVDVVNRDIVLKQLIKLITKSQDSGMILQGLITLKKDTVSPARNIYRDWMCDEALIRATDGDLTLLQLINIVKVLSSYKEPKYRNLVDALWVGISTREQDINAEILAPLFKLLKHFNRSKNLIRIKLEKKLLDHWLKLNGSQIAEILDCFHDDITSTNSLISASKWASVSMNTSTEKDLINLIRSLNAKDYVDNRIEKALEVYLKTKRKSIKNSNLIATIMNYCKHLRMRNVCIFAECGEYFIKHGLNIPTSLLASILTPFGILNIQPPRSVEFWKTFDEVISARFDYLKLHDMLDILLSCTYLERYPVKFTNQVFTSHFLNRINGKKNTASINRAINKLKLLDATMSLESKSYKGPQFLLKTNKLVEDSLFLDNRIRRIINIIYKPLAQLVGSDHTLSNNVILNQLPLINFYILDIVVHPLLVSNAFLSFNSEHKKNINTAILIHLPEYYCRNGQHLIGIQAMRKRHIRKLGFRVVSLEYTMLKELSSQSDKLSSYLSESLNSVEDAL